MNNEHKEIIFKSIVLPIYEDINISAGNSDFKLNFSKYGEITVYLIDFIIHLENDFFIKKIVRMIEENLDFESINMKKIYKAELFLI